MLNTAQQSFHDLFSEVCEEDYYGLRSAPFAPDKIFDLGANVGMFTTYARFLFPQAVIVAVEPEPATYAEMVKRVAHLPGITLLQKALGLAEVWRSDHTPHPPYSGILQSYVTPDQPGFPRTEMKSPPGQEGRDGLPTYTKSPGTKTVTLDELLDEYVGPNNTVLVKMDCEGGENYIFDHEPSMRALRRVDWITMERHYYVKGTGTDYQSAKDKINAALLSLSDTHGCELNTDTQHFCAVKKRDRR